MKCDWPWCTGDHDNHAGHDLCFKARSKKQDRDNRYNGTAKGLLKQVRSNANRRGSRG